MMRRLATPQEGAGEADAPDPVTPTNAQVAKCCPLMGFRDDTESCLSLFDAVPANDAPRTPK
jgi:hypothetical protein